jgi:ATP-dependent RNA helicase DDX3X
VTQKILYVEDRDKFDAVCDMVNQIPGLTLIFVETKRDADSLEYRLSAQGFPATSIHGDRTQQVLRGKIRE